MPTLTLNPRSKRAIDTLKQSLPHAVLLAGRDGVGLATIAASIAGRDLIDTLRPTDRDGQIDLSPKGIIRITQIRALIERTRGKATQRQVVIIDDADQMNHQAQNAFLKLLEEPTPNLHFILTSHHPEALLATVRSRVQQLNIEQVSPEESKRLIHTHGISDERKVQQLLFLASGRPAELTRLLADESRFADQARYITDARTLLNGTPYQRILVAFRYQKDRSGALTMLTLAETVLRHSIRANSSRELIHTADRLATTYERILANGSTRLQLINFVLK